MTLKSYTVQLTPQWGIAVLHCDNIMLTVVPQCSTVSSKFVLVTIPDYDIKILHCDIRMSHYGITTFHLISECLTNTPQFFVCLDITIPRCSLTMPSYETSVLHCDIVVLL